MTQVAASILAADFGRLAEEVRAADRAGADLIHVDVMDGRFVPEISFGTPVIRAVRAATRKPVEAHLMIAEPERHLDSFARAGADRVLVQVEAASTTHLHATLLQARALGLEAGVVLDPATPPEAAEWVLPLCGVVLVMTVNPGAGGRTFLPEVLPKIGRLCAMGAALGHCPRIAVDGGISLANTGAAIAAGAEILVTGTAVFHAADYAAAIAALRGGSDRA
ncbi:ribulose-phosphate 3-epimerase [Siccirubricoccus sp. G192]|uniref:ribulose-phosphate 3-epimerase n=1 Tax=Siccirubricoccus sp. G192 TaxID=2849651 RepID=UPI001C2C04A6|nr:ribulose-phosphate 3-epimerase [Siccirubricoccus sp. G192]MBV1795736.1 ribulose-phosphate 3-epimerase [Siccirubricoccus sp. G192]